MKKFVTYIAVIVSVIGLGYYITVESTSNVKAASTIEEDELCETPKTFTGKTITYKPNNYCKTTCTPKGTTSFPNTVQTVNVDQTVNAGGQFQWEEIRIKTELECETEIYYDQWYKDWNDAIKKLEEALRMIYKEAHQYQSDKATKEPCEIRHYTGVCNPTSATRYSEAITDYNKYTSQLSQIQEYAKDENTSNIRVSEPAKHWTVEGEPDIVDRITLEECNPNHATDPQNEPCAACNYWFNQGSCVKYEIEKIDKYCVQEFTSQKGYKHTYENWKCGDTANTCYPTDTKEYCSISKPYWDNEAFDKYWTLVLREAYANLYSLSQQGLLGKLSACNDNGFEKIYKKAEDPRTIVHYNEPMGKYNDAKNLRLTTKKVSGPTYTEDPSGTVYVTNGTQNLPKVTSDIDAILNSYASFTPEQISLAWKSNVVYNKSTTSEYAKWAKYKVKGKITTEYKYEMPEGFYQYTEKPNGNVQHASQLKPSVLESGNYIDVGFSNYPVHYQTPTGVYPISLTYNMPLVFNDDRLYTCIYRVKNKIACPEGECPDPNDETPPGYYDDPPEPEDPNDPKDPFSGLNVVYRPISLSEPFHYRNGKVRPAGSNWTTEDVTTYIHNNRNQNNDKVYDTSPIYEFTLDAMDISEIRKYNSSHEFSDFELVCKGTDSSGKSIGTRCYSDFLKNYYNRLDAKGSCVNTRVSNFYRCANKPADQDKEAINKAQGKS